MAPKAVTPERSGDAIWLAAPLILRDLCAAGVENPSLELFVDGSGTLKLGTRANLSDEQVKIAVGLVHSERFNMCFKCLRGLKHEKDQCPITVSFCGGLYEEAKKRGLAADGGTCCG